ncbi:MAG: hypothetical protein U1F49_14450 [Rubrivivax sp.]
MKTARLPAWLALLVATLAAIGLLSSCSREGERAHERREPPPDVERFLASHWADPLPPQGPPPESFSELEASLSPQASGQCHAMAAGSADEPAQPQRRPGPALAAAPARPGPRATAACAAVRRWPNRRCCWRKSTAGRRGPRRRRRPRRCAPGARGPGVRGLPRARPSALRRCRPRRDESGTDIDIDIAFDPGAPSDPRPHGGFVAAEAFADSRFCAGCHQFLPDGPRVAGKLQEDTVAQWCRAAVWLRR